MPSLKRSFFLPCLMLGLALALASPQPAKAAVHQVAAPGAAAGEAWPSLDALFKSGMVTGGDEIVLLQGNHGAVRVEGARFDSPVTIRSAGGAEARLTGLTIARSRNLIFDGLQVWPDAPGKGHLIRTEANAPDILFRNLDVRGRADGLAYRGWSRDDWFEARRAGVLLRGQNSAVLSSRFTGLGSGIGVLGQGARIEGNRIRGFSHDGINVAADNASVRGNLIEDCIKIDDTHDDGIQAWSLGPDGRSGKGVLKGLTIENNIILEWRDRDAPELVCALQGIGLFDGMFEGLSIRNNLVMVSAFHGISAYGAIDSRITNNTVLHRTRAGEKHPWIGVFDHKDGRPPRNVVVANNIAPRITGFKKGTPTVVLSRNLEERYPANRLQAPYDGDFTPQANSGLMGAADPARAPAIDILGRTRNDADGPDLGAFERP